MFGLTVIGVLTDLGLFSQILDGFGAGLGIVTPAPSDYILKVIFYYFILYFNINNNNDWNVF